MNHKELGSCTEIIDLNNQIMNHKKLGSCTEINEFGVKKPTNAGTFSSISDPPLLR
jgi:hypothetical protein